MTTAHDVLYPSKDRTIALVRKGDYYKYLDEFTRSCVRSLCFLWPPLEIRPTEYRCLGHQNGFRYTWQHKRWQTFPITEVVWISFHYLRLYIYGFAFQAHVQRATPSDGIASVFPRGPTASPDAKFIFESIDAASEILKICIEQLHESDALRYLPARFFLFFSYAGVFLLKVRTTPTSRASLR
jgi:hypothetical protein